MKTNQKIHRPVARLIIQALQRIFPQNYRADKVIERLFKANRQLGARDRRFIAETTYEMVRWWRLLWACSGQEDRFEAATLADESLWRLLGTWLILRDQTLPSWSEFHDLNPESVMKRHFDAQRTAPLRYSLPDWLYIHGRDQLGDNWDRMLAALNEPAPVVLRANRLKTTREQLREILNDDGVQTHPAPKTEDGLILKERRNVFNSRAFQSGFFEVQDGASQQVAPMLGVSKGLRVIDACAGAGGKTLHLAALMANKGKLIAMDVDERRLGELRKRCVRAGVDIAEVKLIDSSKSIKRLEKSADRVLLDVPCSGLGVLRRNPDAKWKLRPEEMERLRVLQREILNSYSEMTKIGGRMVYATCSILPSENENQVAAFLTSHKEDWRLVEEKKFVPGEDGYDGFYAAALERLA